MAFRFGLILLVAQSAAVLIGNAFEGPLLECLASRRRQDGRGRALQALFHTGFLGLGSSALLLVLFPLFRWMMPDLGFRDALALGTLITPPTWQLLRVLSGRIALRRVARRGPFEIIPARTDRAARRPAAPSDGSPARGPVRPGWSLLPWVVGSLGAGFATFLLLPYWFGLARLLSVGDDNLDVEEVSSLIASIAVVLEVLAAAFAGAGVVLWRHRRFARVPGSGDAGNPDSTGIPVSTPMDWRLLAGFVLPWLALWVPLALYALRVIAGIVDRSDLYGIPMAWIVFTFPIGLIQGVALGVSYGLRRMTAAGAGCQALWFQGLGVLILGSVSTLGLFAHASLPNDFGLLNLGPFVKSWTASSFLRSISLMPESLPTFHPDVLVVLFSVWLGRGLQVLFLAIYRRRIAWNAARVAAPDSRWFGGVAFGWWRLLRGNPVVGRTLGRPPHGGHRWFGALRVGLYLGVVLLIAVSASLAVERIDRPGGPTLWILLGMGFGIGGVLASGAWAGLLGMLAARKVRNSGEEQELHLSLLKGEEIVAGRIAAVFGLTVLWALVLPFLAVWPYALVPEVNRHLWFFATWFVLIYGTTIGSSAGDAAVGLWLGARWKNGVAAGFIAGLWGAFMGSWTAIASLSGIVLTTVWIEESARVHVSDDVLALLGTFGLLWGLIPICTRLALGDWLGRRLAADLLGLEKD